MTQSRISVEELNALDAISLVDVMAANGHYPVQDATSGEYVFRCPNKNHKDSKPSFCVTAEPVEGPGGHMVGAYYCHGCKVHGYGAIALQALLLGLPDKKGQNFITAAQRLCAYSGEKLESISLPAAEYRTVAPVDSVEYESMPWADMHLQALGCEILPVQSGEDTYCSYSWGKGFYGMYDSERLNNFNPETVGEEFDIFPVLSYTTPSKNGKSTRIYSNDYHPIFFIRQRDKYGNSRFKVYRPMDPEFKWSIYNENTVSGHSAYNNWLSGDKDVMASLVPGDKGASIVSSHKGATVEVKHKNLDGEVVSETKFRRVCICSGPRDAMQVYYHSDCHVVWPHSESAEIDPTLMSRIRSIAVDVYLLYDADYIGRRQARRLNLEYLWLHNVELPSDLCNVVSSRSRKPCKDVSEYFENYIPSGRFAHKQNINSHFAGLLSSSENLQFYKAEQTGRVGDKKEGLYNIKYSIPAPPMQKFLYYSGMCRYEDENGNVRLCIVGDNNIVEFIPDRDALARAKSLMDSWLDVHGQGNTELHHVIDQNKTLNRETFSRLPVVHLDFESWGEHFQFFFFRNTAVKVTDEEIVPVAYEDMEYSVNADSILPWDYEHQELSLVTIEDNPLLEERERNHREALDFIDPEDSIGLANENVRWQQEQRLWRYKLRLSKPMTDMPLYFQYLYNTCRFYYRTEEENKRRGLPPDRLLTAEQRQFQYASFISKLAALGYLMSRYRVGAHPYMVLAMDRNDGNQLKSNGRSGKSLTPYVLDLVQKVMHRPGKDMNTADQFARNFWDYDYLRDATIDFSDLPGTFDIERMNNAAEGEMKIKILHHNEVKIPKSKCAKFFLSYNKVFDTTSTSVAGRLWELYYSSYYHIAGQGQEERTPYTEFHRDILVYEPQERQDLINILFHCLQFWFRTMEKVEGPVDNTMSRRKAMASISDKDFMQWADAVICDRWFGVPLPKRDLLVSWFQYKGWTITEDKLRGAQATRFEEFLQTYCKAMSLVINPGVCINSVYDINHQGKNERIPFCSTATFQYAFDSKGQLLNERVRTSRVQVYYIYNANAVPHSSQDVIANLKEDPAVDGYNI